MYIVTFEGKCDFYLKEELIVNRFEDKKIKEATISAKDGNIVINFKSDYSEDKEALYATQKTLEDYRKIFVFETGYEIRDLYWKTTIPLVTDNQNLVSVIMKSRSELKAEVTVIRPLNNEQDLKDKLEKNTIKDYTSYVNLFINISQMKDTIGKFILFYSLLSALHGKQKSVDEFIKSVQPSIECRDSTRVGATFQETIYSFLRNQIGHTTEETETDTLSREISDNIN